MNCLTNHDMTTNADVRLPGAASRYEGVHAASRANAVGCTLERQGSHSTVSLNGAIDRRSRRSSVIACT